MATKLGQITLISTGTHFYKIYCTLNCQIYITLILLHYLYIKIILLVISSYFKTEQLIYFLNSIKCRVSKIKLYKHENTSIFSVWSAIIVFKTKIYFMLKLDNAYLTDKTKVLIYYLSKCDMICGYLFICNCYACAYLYESFLYPNEYGE